MLNVTLNIQYHVKIDIVLTFVLYGDSCNQHPAAILDSHRPSDYRLTTDDGVVHVL